MSICEVSGIEFPSKNGWISIKVKPEKSERYLVIFDNMEKQYCVGFSSFHIATNEFSHTDITHWMPIPELPE